MFIYSIFSFILFFILYLFGITHSYDERLLPQMNSIQVLWDYNDGLQGWARSTPDEMDVDIDFNNAGEITGRVFGTNPYLDSPPLLLRAYDRHFFVFRMLYRGDVSKGRIEIQSESKMKKYNYPFFDNTEKIDFEVTPDGNYHVIYVPIWQHFVGTITRIRLRPAIDSDNDFKGPSSGNGFIIDWIMIAIAPTINKVEGCIDQYYRSSERKLAISNITEVEIKNNGVQSVYSTIFHQASYPFSTTMNCLPEGGEMITLTGKYFGLSNAIVQVNGVDCTEVIHTIPESELTCRLPKGSSGEAIVTVKNGLYYGLLTMDQYLSYAVPADAPSVYLSNFAHHSIDINITPPSPYWVALTITGYRIEWKKLDDNEYNDKIVVGNVTTTTIIGLQSGTMYNIRVLPLTENQKNTNEWRQGDLYGRRNEVKNAILGEYFYISGSTRLLPDINFPTFNAHSTLNHYDENQFPTTFGPTGQSGGEGSYGLHFVGDASIENCNSTTVCCDGFDSSEGCTLTCSSISTNHGNYSNNIGSHQSSRSNSRQFDKYHEIVIDRPENIPQKATSSCGSTIRLTASYPQQTGAVWYSRKMNVREGFETKFDFRISNPSTLCGLMDDVSTYCRSRGGDGLAFVIQNDDFGAIGKEGMEIGYGGINNSIAIEFDTKYNFEQFDAFENHISVHTRGWRNKNSGNHSYSLGSTVSLPDLTDGIFSVRITYSPNFDEDSIFSDSFDASPHISYFLQNADFINGGQADWGNGMGTLKIFLNNDINPVLVVPLNLDSTLNLDHGRAWIGFTASTGFQSWQVQDILSWTLSSTRINPNKYFPPLINNVGAHQCSDLNACVHK